MPQRFRIVPDEDPFPARAAAENGYKATILICGGSGTSADDIVLSQGGGNGCPACYGGATDSCGTISPDDDNPQWEMDRMVDARLMPDAVLLLDDTVLIANGAGRGFQGLKPFYAGNARTKPMVYDHNQERGRRFRGINEDSGIPRMYHSLASMTSDGTVWIGGSNPNNYLATDGPYPTEFRTQRFVPDYLQSGAQQHTINVSAWQRGQRGWLVQRRCLSTQSYSAQRAD